MHLIRNLEGKSLLSLPITSMGGALSRHISTETKNFQPMGANMGILPELGERIKDKQAKYAKIAERGLTDFKAVMAEELK